MDDRQTKLLVTIIDQFIATAEPVGSKKLLQTGIFDCCAATIRNEMFQLEDEGFLEQPHISAGRIPTAKGYRAYVRNHLEPGSQEKVVRKRFDTLREQYSCRKDQERVFDAVALLSHMVPNIAFASVPHKEQIYYMGLANAFRQPEFLMDPSFASGIAEVLERHLHALLGNVDVDEQVRYYIGEDHILPQFQSCSMIVTAYQVRDQKGAIGILGPMRMDYAYSTVALDMVVDMLRSS